MTPERVEALRRAVGQWKQQLVDVSGRNRLLNYRDLKVGTLDLTPGEEPGALNPVALDRLLRGAALKFSDLFSDEELRLDPLKRIASIRKTAQLALEEKGIDTLFLAIGLATWHTEGTGAKPNAPVILVPVNVVPEGAAQREFKLELDGEPHLNPVLAHVLKTELSVDTAAVDGLIADRDPETFAAFGAMLDEIARSWSAVRGLVIDPRVVMGNFSYATMPMVIDLGTNTELFAESDLVAAIAGDAEAKAALAARINDPDPNRPDVDHPATEFLVLDADSSQHQAINRVLGGESLVIQGPPGTGKSQTIANLIAVLVANGKKVLFVAQKRAAIEAVTSRLQRVGLGDLVLDLHGGIGSKRAFAKSLAESLKGVAAIPERDFDDLHTRLVERRSQLVDHAMAMSEVRTPWRLSVHDIQQRLIGGPIDARPEQRLSPDAARSIDRDRFARLSAEIDEWVGLGGHELTQKHPEWAASSIRTPDEARAAFDLVRDLAHREEPQTRTQLFRALDSVGLRHPDTVNDWQHALALLKRVEATLERFQPEIFSLDHSALIEALAPVDGSAISGLMAQMFSSRYRQARKTVAATLKSAEKLSGRDALAAVKRASTDLAEWRQRSSETALPRIPDGLASVDGSVGSLVDRLAAFGAYVAAVDWTGAPHEAVSGTLQRLATDQVVASRIPRIRELETEFTRLGVKAVTDQVGSTIPPGHASHAVEWVWLHTVMDDIQFTDTRLSGFEGRLHSDRAREFAALDLKHLESVPERVRRSAAVAAYAAMNQYTNQADLVKKEAAKKTRHLPVRKLLEQAPQVVTGLRPCWTMSPLLVAEMLPASRDLFDVVIFDEASQIPPAEAIGSLARAPQAVIAGDDKQLPPTPFFGKVALGGDGDDDGDEGDGAIALTADIESILDVARAGPVRETMLLWHYRSRDGRLISFSNAHLYKNALTAFPGVQSDRTITHHLLPFRPIQSSSTRSHPDEVEAVVDMIIDHAVNHSDESLGVIAFGQYHASAIEETLRMRLRDWGDSDLDRFFSESAGDRFFVKNIERVQGDERDVIILSVGYHKAANGTLPYRFGPLLQEGGERRLNVAVTRARSRLALVSSFSAHDMPPGKSSARGVELLRQYLEFAASGGESLGAVVHQTPLNPFELDVLTRLERAGIPVTAQYGVSGYRIDFVCAHPDNPGRMVLAIEADGASYHAAPTARDRDRLRQQVLENLGWSFHRIWSTDWFRDPMAETKRAAEAWVDAVMAADEMLEPERVVEPPQVEGAAATRPSRGPRPRLRRGSPIDEYRSQELVDLACWILSDTLLRTDEELFREMMNELGFRRAGNRIVGALDAAIRTARTRGC